MDLSRQLDMPLSHTIRPLRVTDEKKNEKLISHDSQQRENDREKKIRNAANIFCDFRVVPISSRHINNFENTVKE